MALSEVIQRAKLAGLQGAAICDHDVVLTCIPQTEDFFLIPGAEFSTEYGHLLGLFLREPIEATGFSEIIDAIHAQGGIAVLAHPFQHSRPAHCVQATAAQVDGIEVWNGRADRKNRRANEMAKALAQQCGLPGFAGSDAHVPQEIGNGSVVISVDTLSEEAVKAALLSGKGSIAGTRGKARYVAASQWTKLRKQKAALPAYVKWALFAVKCVLVDITGG